MEDVVEALGEEKLLALGALLGLHDPDDPDDATWAHIYAADQGDEKRPFSAISHDSKVTEIKREISTAGGHTFANMVRGGKGVGYRDAVWSVAKHTKVNLPPASTIAEAEGLIAQHVFEKMISELTKEQRAELEENLERIATQHGKSFKKHGGALAVLTAAQLSGFGVYMLASAVVGAVTGILGITLSFGFYTAMSSVISVVIGPMGWAFLGLGAFWKVGAPNMKKLVPAVLFIAAERNQPLSNE